MVAGAAPEVVKSAGAVVEAPPAAAGAAQVVGNRAPAAVEAVPEVVEAGSAVTVVEGLLGWAAALAVSSRCRPRRPRRGSRRRAFGLTLTMCFSPS